MRIALAPINPIIGDIAGNAALIIQGIERARAARCDLVAFPELALCGYPPMDLLVQEGFVESCIAHAKEIGEKHSAGITVVFGLPLPRDPKAHRAGGPIHNSLLVYRDNQHVAYYDKRLLPTYDVFDEDRYFEPGKRAVVIDVPSSAPFPLLPGGGRGEVSASSLRIGLTICEDLWKGEDAGFAHRYDTAPDPVAELVAAGAQVILSPSASPFVLGKLDKHRAILRGHAQRHNVHVLSLNQLGGNDELIFDGHALAYAPGGQLLASGSLFTGESLIVEIPDSASDREGIGSGYSGVSVPSRAPEPTLIPERLLFDSLVLGIRDYLRKCGFRSALIGLSGGIDSALTAVLAAAAIGPANVLGLAMPSKYSSQHSLDDAYDLAKRLGMRCETIAIEPPLDGFRATIDPAFDALDKSRLGSTLPDLTEENIQSRIRGTTLMTVSNRTGAIVLTTGNKSELAVGYCTLYGDMNGGLAVLSDVSKQWIYRLSRYINAHHAELGFGLPPIPQRTIDKAPSAELRPNQTDQDSLPPYDVLDEIIERYVERRESSQRIIVETGFDAAVVNRCVRLIDLAEYKRKQAAIGLKVTTVAFGSGRRVPVAQKWRG